MHKIEKELSEVAKLSRKEEESKQDFFKRAQAKLLNESFPEASWAKLSEEAQLWANAASVAVEKGEAIPDFDGTVEEEAKDEGGEADGDAAGDEAETGEGEKKPTKAPPKKPAKKNGGKDGKKPVKVAPKKPAKAVPAAKKKAAEGGAKRGRKGEFNEDSKITKVVAENPFRDGSKASDCFKQYKVGRTVKQVLAAGIPRSKLARHAKKGVVTIG